MNIVAIDTATEAFSVALKCGDQLYSRYQVEPRMHAKLLLPALDELFAEAQISRSQLDAVAFGRGPGAFTGVRIATAAAQAIALANDIPVVPVSTLAAIAGRVHREAGLSRVAVAIDARMGEVYFGAYRVEGAVPQLVGAESVCKATDVAGFSEQGEQWFGAGTGWNVWAEQLATATGAQAPADLPELPHAHDVLEIGQSLLVQGAGVDAADALPVYLRDNVAKTEAERRSAG